VKQTAATKSDILEALALEWVTKVDEHPEAADGGTIYGPYSRKAVFDIIREMVGEYNARIADLIETSNKLVAANRELRCDIEASVHREALAREAYTLARGSK
jgi:hypothetical protein